MMTEPEQDVIDAIPEEILSCLKACADPNRGPEHQQRQDALLIAPLADELEEHQRMRSKTHD